MTLTKRISKVDRDLGIALLEGLIESLNSVSISKKKRRELYSLWFTIFEENGFEDFQELVSDEDTRDEAYDAAYEQEFGS